MGRKKIHTNVKQNKFPNFYDTPDAPDFRDCSEFSCLTEAIYGSMKKGVRYSASKLIALVDDQHKPEIILEAIAKLVRDEKIFEDSSWVAVTKYYK